MSYRFETSRSRPFGWSNTTQRTPLRTLHGNVSISAQSGCCCHVNIKMSITMTPKKKPAISLSDDPHSLSPYLRKLSELVRTEKSHYYHHRRRLARNLTKMQEPIVSIYKTSCGRRQKFVVFLCVPHKNRFAVKKRCDSAESWRTFANCSGESGEESDGTRNADLMLCKREEFGSCSGKCLSLSLDSLYLAVIFVRQTLGKCEEHEFRCCSWFNLN